MAKVTFLDKLRFKSSPLAAQYKLSADDVNELKNSINAVYDSLGTSLPGIYKALLSQTGTSAPIVTVLVNTLGFTPTWVRNAAGQYYISETFNGLKSFGLANLDQYNTAAGSDVLKFYFDNDEYNGLNQFWLVHLTGSDINGTWQIPIQIEVYP